MDEADAEGRTQAFQELGPGLVRPPPQVERAHATVVEMFLDLPPLTGRDGQIVPVARPRRLDQRADVVLGSAAMAVNDVQHTARGSCNGAMLRLRRVAQRPQRIGGDVRTDDLEIVRMTVEQQRHVARAQLRLAAGERTLAQVHDEGVVAEHVAESGPHGAQAEIVLLAVTVAERGIEGADRVDQRAADVQAETDACGQIGIGRNRRLRERRAHGLGLRAVRPWVVLAESRKRADLRVVREWRCRADPRIGVHATRQRVEPAGGDDGVRVEQHDVGAGQSHPAIRGGGEAPVLIVAQQDDVWQRSAGELRDVRADCRVRRRVVDQDQPVRARRVGEHALDAVRDVGRGVEDRDHHVDRGGA